MRFCRTCVYCILCINSSPAMCTHFFFLMSVSYTLYLFVTLMCVSYLSCLHVLYSTYLIHLTPVSYILYPSITSFTYILYPSFTHYIIRHDNAE